MKKILFLPFFQMQSGHQHVADALMDMIEKHTNDFTVKKIDLLSYTSKSLEKLITKGYLKWINYAPKSYDATYQKRFNNLQLNNQQTNWYDALFRKKMEEIIREENPDLIVCTHGFPSHILSQLKQRGRCPVPVINAYTDFFMNSVWGVEGIEGHLLPNQEAKEKLSQLAIPEENMVVTGIPVHEEITAQDFSNQASDRPTVLIAGGSSGLGDMLDLFEELKKARDYSFIILCGRNKHLYDQIQSWDLDNVKALPYIASKKEMNRLYDEADAIITKPGGVTISEALQKRIPIFVHAMLPGQEKINYHYLMDKGLIFSMDGSTPLEEQLSNVLWDKGIIDSWKVSLVNYLNGMEMQRPERMVQFMEGIMAQGQERIASVYTSKRRFAIIRKYRVQISK